MTKRTNDIDRQAAEWVARTDGVEPSAEVQRALEDWLALDARHLGAYLKANAVMARVGRLGPALRPGRLVFLHSSLFARRRVVLVGAIAASIAAVVFISNTYWWNTPSTIYTTDVGKSRIVALTDGSSVTMNTNTKIVVRYSDNERSVTLEQGEALFTVAKNKERPFVVDTGDISVRAVGTRFTVRALPNNPVDVLVAEGIVCVDRQSTPLIAALRANSHAVISGSRIAIDTVSPLEISQNLAWRDGRIFFRHQTLAAAALEFARYNKTDIVIDDPAIARLTVTGAYVADDPIGFARAVALAFDLDAVAGSNEVRLARRRQ
jgi:transmembrane sensor